MTMPSTDQLFSTVQRALAGQYSLERELGRGGMGVVYLAREVELDRHVALKVLPPERAADAATRERFLREARMAASLSHPHVVPIFRVGEASIVFFSMAFVDGETLGERLRTRGPLTPSAATRMLREVAQALAYAHLRGIIHRDVKPDNILLERESGRALVSDFGIAAGASSLGDATTDRIMGTQHFMSPEQATGEIVDARSDIYSLGVVGFLALSGKLPRAGESLAGQSPSIPHHLVRAIDRALAIQPEARPANAEGFADALDARGLARADMPAPLREWVTARDPWTIPYVLWTAIFATMTVQMLLEGGSDWWLIAEFAALPLLPATLFQSGAAGRVFRAGYTVADMRDALEAWIAETEHARAAVPAPPTPWWHTPARLVAWAPAAGIAAVTFRLIDISRIARATDGLVMPLTVVAGAVALPILNAIGVSIFPRLISTTEKPLSRAFWNSRLGTWAEKLLMIGQRRTAATSAFRPTERVLGSAVEDLFDALPPAYREQLRELPAVVSRLQAHAKVARQHLVHLEGVTAVGRDAQLSTAREQARRQLAESVGAIEMIRLDLLRLIGGDADLAPTTTVLDAARKIDSGIQRLRAGRDDAERAVRPIGLDLRPHSPA